MKKLILITVTCLFVARTLPASGQDQNGYVSRAEYDKLKLEHDQLKLEMEQMKHQLGQLGRQQQSTASRMLSQPVDSKDAAAPAEAGQLEELSAQVEQLKTQVKETIPGTNNLLITGYGTASFTSTHSGVRNFNNDRNPTAFNPILIWKLSDRLYFEGELEFQLSGGQTTTNLEQAYASYTVNDFLTLQAGRFLNPMDYFVEYQHPNWINKLPDKPLAVYDGLLPESLLGAQLRGVLLLGPTKVEYSGFVAQAPQLITTPASLPDLSDLGQLSDDVGNTDNHLAYGGRVGFLPIPQLDIGYGIMASNVGTHGNTTSAVLQSVDMSYVRDSDMLKGIFNLHAQWVWSNVGSYTYDADGSQGFGPLTFSNHRSGGYAQIAYRPTKLTDSVLRNFEPVVRFDMLNQDNTPVGYNERRLTIGLNYWLNPSTVFKVAYEFDHRSNGVTSDDALMLQFVTGF